MQKYFWVLTSILWILTVITAVILISKNGPLSLFPIYAHNQPQGPVGWLFGFSILLTAFTPFISKSNQNHRQIHN